MFMIKYDIVLLDFLWGWLVVFVFFYYVVIFGGGLGYLIGVLGKEVVNVFMMVFGFLIYL